MNRSLSSNWSHLSQKINLFVVEKSAKLKKWKSREVNGLIFVWYHAENEKPWDIPSVRELESKSWVFHGKNEFLVNSHIQDIPENGADVGEIETKSLIELLFIL